jgi:glycosyltransferase involved in cell wall biosynthesis
MKKILVVGQTPPPLGGQAVMIQYFVEGVYHDIEVYHVRMNFSKNFSDLGHYNLWKIVHLISIIFHVYYFRFFKGVTALYYPPSGPTNGVYRDMALLLPTRFLFKQTVFHFHASGLHEKYMHMSRAARWLFRMCFWRPDLAVHLSESVPQEGRYLEAMKNVIIPNGIPDQGFFSREIPPERPLNLLFVGLLNGTKGELDVLEAMAILRSKGVETRLKVAGMFGASEHERRFHAKVEASGLSGCVSYIGLIQGGAKDAEFRNADVFCFPSFFPSESFPVVLLESMQHTLPIVATRWRGIPDMVTDGFNGFLVEPHDPAAVAKRILALHADRKLLLQLGRNGRARYEERYSLSVYLKSMESAISSI